MYKRKTYIINKEFQYGFIATFQFIIILSLLIFSAGFFIYYWIAYMTGDRVYNEFLSLSQQITIQIQPVTEDDIKDPIGLLAQLGKGNENKEVIGFIRENFPPAGLVKLDSLGENSAPADVKAVLVEDFNDFLRTLITRRIEFYKPERFRDINLSPATVDRLGMKIEPQSTEMYNLNLMLLADIFKPKLQITLSNTGLEPLNYQKEIVGLKRHEIVLPPLLINNLLIMLLIIIVGIFYSHRIAGPMYRIETDIKRVLDGEKNVEIHLRKKDKLQSLADLVNQLIKKMEKTKK
jgi:methyl-accepting chemotaxis protein